jgi:hypothetical protein
MVEAGLGWGSSWVSAPFGEEIGDVGLDAVPWLRWWSSHSFSRGVCCGHACLLFYQMPVCVCVKPAGLRPCGWLVLGSVHGGVLLRRALTSSLGYRWVLGWCCLVARLGEWGCEAAFVLLLLLFFWARVFLRFFDPSVPSLLLNGGAISAVSRDFSRGRCPHRRRSASLKSKTHVLSGALPCLYDELVISGSAGCISEALQSSVLCHLRGVLESTTIRLDV